MKILKTFLTTALFLGLSLPAFAEVKPKITLKTNPPDAGDNQLTVSLLDEKGHPIADANVAVAISMPAMGTMPRMEDKAVVQSTGPGMFTVKYSLAMAGTWEMALAVQASGKKQVFNYTLTTGVPDASLRGVQDQGGPSDAGAAHLLPIGPSRLQRIGVRFADVQNIVLQKPLRAAGVVEADNTRRAEVTLRYSGYAEKQLRGRAGDLVAAGTPLLSVYSPELIAAENEFLLAHSSGAIGLHASTAERLKNLGLSAADIAKIKKRGEPEHAVTIKAPVAGTILDVNIREGGSFSPGQALYSIGDLSKIYVVGKIFQRDLSDLKAGQEVSLVMPESGGRAYKGKIDLIFPSVNEGEGSGNVRVVATEAIPELRPGLYVDLRFSINLGQRLVVPTTAVLFSGLHQYVFVDRGDGNLEPREVQTGKSTEEWTEIVMGLKAGERVVSSGTFLISSEAQLRSALPKWGAVAP